MGNIQNSPYLLQKVLFIQKYSQKAHVTHSSISSSSISVCLPNLCDTEFGIESKDLSDLMRSTTEFVIEDGVLKYSFESTVGDKMAKICKKIELISLNYTFEFENPILTAKVPIFKCISIDNTFIIFSKNKLLLQTSGYVKTRNVLDAQRVDGVDCFEICVSGKDLKIVEELGTDLVLCCYQNCIVVFSFENDISTAVVVRNV
ncbi:uncharacterized protein VICG_01229 [Vittaforma corneae ATCC 50505]|uniref:Uncharacterized protein n=1 Tax=Vittaforma corneae (strain ATCC 50505) TaxID=993615 RepID=L2GMK7_VITCO|nr:uncharacterized protein VICG_01229 [Vittaforma corneae ATCC 50505]ELA41725.1 hypothetical protein VICG_01229 [Vittaforma corneae ATCC 50505]